MRLATGTYVGNGLDNRPITGLGFQPDAVFVKRDGTLTGIFFRTKDFVGDQSCEVSAAFVTNGIQAILADGFEVGTRGGVNDNGLPYAWMAFKEEAGRCKVGAYVGDGTDNRNIGGVGFQPDAIIIKGDNGQTMVGRWGGIGGDNSWGVLSSGKEANLVQAFLADGFQIGSALRVNASGIPFFYVAWKNGGSQVAGGTFTGNGTDNRNIAGVGFAPTVVFLKNENASGFTGAWRPAALVGDETAHFGANANTANEIQALQADGFQVGSDGRVNRNGDPIWYFAARDEPPAPPPAGPPAGSLALLGVGK